MTSKENLTKIEKSSRWFFIVFIIFHTAIYYLLKYGPIYLFFALLGGIVGLPIPDELILMGSGYLVAHHKMHPAFTILAAMAGSICGITISYLIGKLAYRWFVKKYAKKLNITEEKIKLVKSWFSKFGKWLLLIGYFIPIVRHIVGIVAGGARMSYKQFALFAYTGAIIWSLTFLIIGYFLEGVKVDHHHLHIQMHHHHPATELKQSLIK